MALQTMILDPNAAAELTPDQVIDKINAASEAITRASCVSASARPLVDSEVTSGKLASGVAKINLDSMNDLDRAYIKTEPGSGEFKIIAVERTVDGKMAVKYDDGA